MLTFISIACLVGWAFAATGSTSSTTSVACQSKGYNGNKSFTYHDAAHHHEIAAGDRFGKLSVYKYYVPASHKWKKSHINSTNNQTYYTSINFSQITYGKNCLAKNWTIELETFVAEWKCMEQNACHVPHAAHAAHGAHASPGQYIVLYVIFILAVGCICRYIIKRLNLPLQYTVVLMGVGLLFEAIVEAQRNNGRIDPNNVNHLVEGGVLVRNIDAHMILVLFIPALIFESAFSTDYHTIVKERDQALMLAGPGVILNTLFTGCVMHYFNDYDWTWSFSFMFGAIVSATDPVAVVALLKELGASKRLSTLIEAESLLNDGTAFVLFVLLEQYAASATGQFDLTNMITRALQLAVAGTLWGILIGMITYRAIGLIFSDFQVEITITLVACYVGFYIGDFLIHVSGVLAVVFLGLVVSKNRSAITPAIEETMHGFWEMIGFIANTVLFFITGQIIMFKVLSTNHIGAKDVGFLVALYIAIHATRGLTIWILFPVLESVGYGCDWKDASVMLYGGLRGAIGLALALIVETQPMFDKKEKDQVLFHVSGVVVLTLVINASTVGSLVNFLDLNKPPADSKRLLKGATEHIMEETHEAIHRLKNDKNFAGANWHKVEELMPDYERLLNLSTGDDDSETKSGRSSNSLQEPSESAENEDEEDSLQTDTDFDHHNTPGDPPAAVATAQEGKIGSTEALTGIEQHTVEGEDSESSVIDKAPTFMGRIGSISNVLTQYKTNQKEEREKRQVERRFIFVMKASYWGQFEKGLIGQDAVRVLVEAADSAIDENDLSTQRKMLKKYFRIPKYLKWMHNSANTFIKSFSERLLFGNLGFAIEIASAFVYASEQAHEFAELLLHSGTVDKNHVQDVKAELEQVTSWISDRSHRVQVIYPEVHQAIQTEHAATYLLHTEKHNILHLYHKGFLEDAEYSRVNGLADKALNKLFRTGYSEFLETETAEELFLGNALFSDLTKEQKEVILKGATSQHLMPKDDFVFSRREQASSIFVITRGAVAVMERIDPGASIHAMSAIDWANPTREWKEIEIKGRNEMFEIWPVLHESPQIHSFKVTSENCSGFSVSVDVLLQVAQENNKFWERLWRTAAVELVKYFFKDQEVFVTFDLSHLENFMDEQDLEYVDSAAEDSLILVNTTCAILLNGSVLHMDAPGEDPIAAPVVLLENDVPYVPFEDCVVIYLDMHNRHAGHVFGDFGAHTMRKMLHINTRNVLQTVQEQHEQHDAEVHAPPRAAGSMQVNNPLTQLSRVRSRTTVAAGQPAVQNPMRPLDLDPSRIPRDVPIDALDEDSAWEVLKFYMDKFDYMEDINRYARQRMKEAFAIGTPRASSRQQSQPDDEKEAEPKIHKVQSVGVPMIKKFARPSTVNLLGPAQRSTNAAKRRSAQFAQIPLSSPLMGRNASAGAAPRVEDFVGGLPMRGVRAGSKAARPTIVVSKRYQRQTRNINRPESIDFDNDVGTQALTGGDWVLREEAETPLVEMQSQMNNSLTNSQNVDGSPRPEEAKKQDSILNVDDILSGLAGPSDSSKFSE